MSNQLIPLAHHVLVLTDEVSDMTPSGLTVVRRWNPDVTGVVVAVGRGRTCARCGYEQQPGVAVGEHIVFTATSGEMIMLDGTRYILLEDQDILAVIDEEGEGRHVPINDH